MLPVRALSCKTREILKGRLKADLKVYRDAVDMLDAATITQSGTGFEKVFKRAEVARRAFEGARERFNIHVASHGCGSHSSSK
jgi:hypothetical protein